MAVTVREFQSSDAAQWDEFVRAHPQGTPFHLMAWKRTLESTFGYQARYLLAVEGSTIEGLLPLFLIDNPLMGKVLLSAPFAVYGGILARSTETRQAIAERLAAIAKSLEVQHVELRNWQDEQAAGFDPVQRYVTFHQELKPQTGEELIAALPKKTRNMVRKALKFNYTSRMAPNLNAFYSLMTRSYRRLGTPIFPKRFFETMLREFGPVADSREIVLDGRVVACSLNLLFHEQMHTFYAASDQKFLAMAPNNYLYYDHLLWAGQNGYRLFDFGRSKLETGTYDFKSHWLTTMRELPYEVLLVKRQALPNFSPKNPKFDLAIRVWQKIPLPVTRVLGPRLVQLFP
jgi:FemAB-related protein (PEP-CTERM system-associated)